MSEVNSRAELIAAVDIGTSKVVVAAMLCPKEESSLLPEVVGIAQKYTTGVKKGLIVSIEDATEAIRAAVQEVEVMIAQTISSLCVGVSGAHVHTISSTGMSSIFTKEVDITDVERVIDIAKRVPIPADQKILHVLPQEFIVDGQRGVRDPVGMNAIRLEVRLNIVTVSLSALQNIMKCVRSCGLQINDVVLQGLASGMVVSTDDEKNLGVCVVDIGAGTADVSVFSEGVPVRTVVLPVAGDYITNDISISLRISQQHAEHCKITHGYAYADHCSLADTFEVPTLGQNGYSSFSQQTLSYIIQARLEEIFELIALEIAQENPTGELVGGLILTGGTSSIPGILELAQSVLGIPVRLGVPRYTGSSSELVNQPCFSSVYGLLSESLSKRRYGYFSGRMRIRHILSRVKNWFQMSF